MVELIAGLLTYLGIVSGVVNPKFESYCYFFLIGIVALIVVTLMNHYGGRE